MAQANDTAAASRDTTTSSSPRFLSLGDGNEILQVALAPGESIIANEKAFCYRGLGLKATELHDPNERGAIGRAFGWTGVKLGKVMKWANEGQAPTYIGLSVPLPGKVIPVDLQKVGTVLSKAQVFLCSVADNQVTTQNLKLTPEGPFPVYDVDLRKLSGSGMCYIQAGGAAVQKTLGHGESMVVEIGCVAAYSESCKVVAEQRTGLVREPPYSRGFNVKISGPGTIFMQSTNVGRVRQSLLTERALVRGGAVEVFKGAAMVAVMVAVLFAFFEV